MNAIQTSIAALRRSGMTQQSISTETGLCQSTISKWERTGGPPSVRAIVKLLQLAGALRSGAVDTPPLYRAGDVPSTTTAPQEL